VRLIIKPSRKSGERDTVFTTEYGGVKYSVGPQPAQVPDDVGRYLLTSFSALIELAEEPAKKSKKDK